MKSDVRDNISAVTIDLEKWREFVTEKRSLLGSRKSSSRVDVEPKIVLKRHAQTRSMNFEFPEV